MSLSDPTYPRYAGDRLQALLSRSDIWRASAIAGSGQPSSSHTVMPRRRHQDEAVDTGYSMLNEALVAQGWPLTGIVELQADTPGSGAWQLLLPALADRHIALLGPPYLPYAPALSGAGIDLCRLLVINPPEPAGLLWAAEQVLRSGACGAVLLWEPQRFFQYRELRKLQLAASESKGLFFLLRSSRSAGQVSPAVLRIHLRPEPEALSLTLLKQRGGRSQPHILIPAPPLWRTLPALSQMPVGLQRCRHGASSDVSHDVRNGALLGSNASLPSSAAISTQIPLI